MRQKRLVWGVILVLVTAMASLSYISGLRYFAAVSAIEHTLRVEAAVDGTLSLLKDAETGQRGYILTADARFLEPYQAALAHFSTDFARLSLLLRGDPQQLARANQLRALIDDKFEFMAETVRLRREGKEEQALVRVRSGEGKRRMDVVRDAVQVLRSHEEARLEQRKTAAEHAESMALWGVGIGSLLTVLFAAFSFITVHRDVTTLRNVAEELATSEEYYRLLTEHSSDLVRLLGPDGKILYVSNSVERLLGYEVDEYLKLAPRSLLHPDEQGATTEVLMGIISGATSEGLSTYRILHKSGEYRWFEVRWAARRDADRKLLDIHTVARDVTERREAEQQLSAQAEELRSLSLRDELTGLYNRRGFLEIAEQARVTAHRDARAAAVLFIDLNGMKQINDQQGHEVGDLALRDAASVIKASLREADVVARLGGDEFAAFVLDFGPADLDSVRARLRASADAQVADQGRSYRLSMSLGAAYVQGSDTTALATLLERADSAMYEQKNTRRARGGVSTYPPPDRG